MSSKARPSSAISRTTAWGDYGHANPDHQFNFGQEIRNDPDLNPTAMEDDSGYQNADKGKGKSSSVVPSNSTKQSTSFFGKIGGGIRSLWATRQTEDVKGDRELHVKTTLRELIVYIVFLVVLCVVTFGMTSTTMYYYTKVMSDLFLDSTNTVGGSFRTITSVEDFWRFAKQPLLKGLYWETWYNNQTVPDDQLGYIYYENRLLGVPRIRQLQVHSNSCVVHDDFKDVIRECYEAYAESLENKQPFGEKDNYTAWHYQTQDELKGSSHWGLIATYSGAGYIQDLTRNRSESEAIINYLFDKRWVQRGTRALFIDFTVYNANINLFCVVRLAVEFPPTGGAIPQATMRTVKLIRYVTVMDYFIMACEVIFCLFICYYMIEEAIEIKKNKLSYFKSFWNILDILVIIIAIVCVAFNIYRYISVNNLLQELLDKPNQYSDFEFLAYCQTQFDNAIAIAVFLAWIKIFKYISFNKTMTQLSSTLGKCAKDLAGFAVMFFIIFLAFTQLGYLLFGTQVKDFSDFKNSFFTLFRIILGDFDFDQLEAANRVLGPLFFMLFVFFVFFVLINMFLAIINDTYSEVKGDMANQKNEFEMTDYFKRGYEKMLSKLNFKHDKIVDIQKALRSADINNDKQVDFDEWRQDLKTRGYADGEIEALFAKYDVDGDRTLDEAEQQKMQADLEGQKHALTKEYDELDKVQRPESARRSGSAVSYNDDSPDDSDDEDSRAKSSRSGPSQSVSYEEFTVLSRRVDRMEHSIGSIVSKIDAVLVKLEAMEKAKLKRRETMGKILDSITESDGTSDEVKREQMEKLVREELERWDSESSITPQPSGRGASPSSSGRGGARSRSRPESGGNATSSIRLIEPETTNGVLQNKALQKSDILLLKSDWLEVEELEVPVVTLEEQCVATAQTYSVDREHLKSPELQTESPQVQAQHFELSNESPQFQTLSPNLQTQSPQLQAPIPQLQVQSSRIQTSDTETCPSSLYAELPYAALISNKNKHVRSATPNLPGVVPLSLSPIPEQYFRENTTYASVAQKDSEKDINGMKPTRIKSTGSSRPTSAKSAGSSISTSTNSSGSSRPTSAKPAEYSRPASAKPAESSRPASAKSAESSMPASAKPAESSRPASAKPAESSRPASAKPAESSRPASAKSAESSRPASANSSESSRPTSAKSVGSSSSYFLPMEKVSENVLILPKIPANASKGDHLASENKIEPVNAQPNTEANDQATLTSAAFQNLLARNKADKSIQNEPLVSVSNPAMTPADIVPVLQSMPESSTPQGPLHTNRDVSPSYPELVSLGNQSKLKRPLVTSSPESVLPKQSNMSNSYAVASGLAPFSSKPGNQSSSPTVTSNAGSVSADPGYQSKGSTVKSNPELVSSKPGNQSKGSTVTSNPEPVSGNSGNQSKGSTATLNPESISSKLGNQSKGSIVTSNSGSSSTNPENQLKGSAVTSNPEPVSSNSGNQSKGSAVISNREPVSINSGNQSKGSTVTSNPGSGISGNQSKGSTATLNPESISSELGNQSKGSIATSNSGSSSTNPENQLKDSTVTSNPEPVSGKLGNQSKSLAVTSNSESFANKSGNQSSSSTVPPTVPKRVTPMGQIALYSTLSKHLATQQPKAAYSNKKEAQLQSPSHTKNQNVTGAKEQSSSGSKRSAPIAPLQWGVDASTAAQTPSKNPGSLPPPSKLVEKTSTAVFV